MVLGNRGQNVRFRTTGYGKFGLYYEHHHPRGTSSLFNVQPYCLKYINQFIFFFRYIFGCHPQHCQLARKVSSRCLASLYVRLMINTYLQLTHVSVDYTYHCIVRSISSKINYYWPSKLKHLVLYKQDHIMDFFLKKNN